MRKGIDVSYHQGNIDFDLVKSNGVDFVILREGYRDSLDNKFFEYVKQTKESELDVLAVYHFSYALNEEEARKEARFCVENMKNAGLNSHVAVFYDFEYDTVNKAAQKGVTLTKSDCNKHTIAFCEEVKRLGFIPGVYANLDYYNNWYDKEVLDKYYLWLADYDGAPDVNCSIQQYSDKGSIPGIKGNVDLNYHFDDEIKIDNASIRSRSEVVRLATSWIGKKESDGSHKSIIDIYNSFSGKLPRGIKMEYGWSWCACTWSALAIALGYTDIMPIEISCGYLIEEAKKMGIWKESDSYIPSPGDAILYDWQDTGNGDNAGWPDHVGVVDYVDTESGYMTVIEGNYNDAVKKRTISINGKYIRGFIVPKYTDNAVIFESAGATTKDINVVAREVISGLWGNGPQRKDALEKSGFKYTDVQAKVNEILNGSVNKQDPIDRKISATCYATYYDKSIAGVYETTADVYCRNDAGTNKKALALIPKGTKVRNYGYFSRANDIKWLSIQFVLDGIEYIGFTSSKYLYGGQ